MRRPRTHRVVGGVVALLVLTACGSGGAVEPESAPLEPLATAQISTEGSGPSGPPEFLDFLEFRDRDLFWQYSSTFWVIRLDDVRAEPGSSESVGVGARGVVSDVIVGSDYLDEYPKTADTYDSLDPRPGDQVMIVDQNEIGFDVEVARSSDAVIGLQPGGDAYVLAFVAVEQDGRWTFSGPNGELFTSQARRLEDHLGGVASAEGLRAVHAAVIESNSNDGVSERYDELASAIHVPGLDGAPWSLTDPLGPTWDPDLVPVERRESIAIVGLEFVVGDGLGDVGPDGPIGVQVVSDVGVSHTFEWSADDHFALVVAEIPGGLEVLGDFETGTGPALLRLMDPRPGQVAVVSVDVRDGGVAVELQDWRPPSDDEAATIAAAGFGVDGRLADG